jgi:1-acylglycerone phosphate reductase
VDNNSNERAGTYNASKAAVNLLSENLRLELAPFQVRVITLMAGNVASNISANKPTVNISSTSHYLPIKNEVEAEESYSDMPTQKFVDKVVEAVVGGSAGKVWIGSNVWVVRIALFWLPGWAIVSGSRHSVKMSADFRTG